jgi:hexosaminidase
VTAREGTFILPDDLLSVSGCTAPEILPVFQTRLRAVPGYQAVQVAPGGADASIRFLSGGEIDVEGREVDSGGEEINSEPELSGSAGYHLKIAMDGITVTATERAGFILALTSLFQLTAASGGLIPCQTFADAPRYHYRGFMLDSCRHLFSVETILSLLEQCSVLKINRFHWHLSDDQGFRIESLKYPMLNQTGSWRWDVHHEHRYGGYYTQAEIREVVAYADVRGIEIIPEIDLPGHSTAIIASYPELSCTGEPCEVETEVRGIFDRILCAGKEAVYEWIFGLLDEVSALFPADYFHIGGDETVKTAWAACPLCKEKMREQHLEDFEHLQAYFTERVSAHLRGLGKVCICWNEAILSGMLEKNIAVQYWNENHTEPYYAYKDIEKGRKFIMSNQTDFYCDFPYEHIPLEATYVYEPHFMDGTAVPKGNMLGLEAPLWTEYVEDMQKLHYQIFPRLYALAENAWTQQRKKNFPDFCARLERLEQLLGTETIAD